MTANKLSFSLLFYPESSDYPVPPLYYLFLSICLSSPYQEDDVKVKQEEELSPLTQLAHSSTLEQEVRSWLVTVDFICTCSLLKSVFKKSPSNEK